MTRSIVYYSLGLAAINVAVLKATCWIAPQLEKHYLFLLAHGGVSHVGTSGLPAITVLALTYYWWPLFFIVLAVAVCVLSGRSKTLTIGYHLLVWLWMLNAVALLVSLIGFTFPMMTITSRVH